MLQKNNKIHKHKAEIQKRIMNIQKKLETNGSAPSTAITTNRKQLLFNNDILHSYQRSKDSHKTSYQATITTSEQNQQNQIPEGRRTFSYGQQTANRSTQAIKYRKYRQNYTKQTHAQQEQNVKQPSQLRKNEKNNKYLNQYMSIIQPESKPFGKISSTRRNISENFGTLAQNKQNIKISESIPVSIQNTITRNIHRRPQFISRQQHNQRNQNTRPYQLYKQRQPPQKNHARKDSHLQEMLQEVVSNQKKLHDEVSQLKSQLQKQNQKKQNNKSSQRHFKSMSNQNSNSLNVRDSCIYSFSGHSNHNTKVDQNKNQKYTEYQLPAQSSIKNSAQKLQICHDPYMKTIDNNSKMISQVRTEDQYNYDRVVKMVKQLVDKNRHGDKQNQNFMRIEDNQETDRQEYECQPKKIKDKSQFQIKSNVYKQKLYSIVKVGKPNTQRYVVPEQQKEMFYQQLKNRIMQAEHQYTDIMHRNNRFEHERLISANELQKKIRDNALAIIYQQSNKCVYK